MSWTKTPPKDSTVWHYWRKNSKSKWTIALPTPAIGGEWWDSPVPEPGTTWTISQVLNWMRNCRKIAGSKVRYANIYHPEYGIAAVTERKEK